MRFLSLLALLVITSSAAADCPNGKCPFTLSPKVIAQPAAVIPLPRQTVEPPRLIAEPVRVVRNVVRQPAGRRDGLFRRGCGCR